MSIFVAIVLVLNMLAAFLFAGLLISYVNNFVDRDVMIHLTVMLIYAVLNAAAGFMSLDNEQRRNQETACRWLVKEGSFSRVEMGDGNIVCIVEGGPNITFEYKVKEL